VARAAYFGMCEYFDQLVGCVLAKLAETGLDRNTLVVYCSDHGEMAGEHGCWWKSNYYEGSVGVPIIASLPGVVPEGTRSDTICNLMDLGVTGVELAGGEPLPDADGHSLWKTLQGEGEDPSRPDETFSELGGGRDEAPSRMIRRGRWKLYKYHDETPAALFDIEDDPDEMNDLGGDPGHEALRKELLARLYEGWDPAFVREEGECLRRDRDVVAAWGKAVQPRHEDAVEVPDEEDVQLR
jgi:choline-sulfatase